MLTYILASESTLVYMILLCRDLQILNILFFMNFRNTRIELDPIQRLPEPERREDTLSAFHCPSSQVKFHFVCWSCSHESLFRSYSCPLCWIMSSSGFCNYLSSSLGSTLSSLGQVSSRLASQIDSSALQNVAQNIEQAVRENIASSTTSTGVDAASSAPSQPRSTAAQLPRSQRSSRASSISSSTAGDNIEVRFVDVCHSFASSLGLLWILGCDLMTLLCFF